MVKFENGRIWSDDGKLVRLKGSNTAADCLYCDGAIDVSLFEEVDALPSIDEEEVDDGNGD